MRYLNKITGVVIETKCICGGDNWQDVTPASETDAAEQAEPKTVEGAESKPAEGKKGKKEA